MQPMWAAFEQFVEQWYAQPLKPDLSVDAEIAATEKRLGCQFPEALRTWYQVSNNRLNIVQDLPQRLSDLHLDRPDRLVIWRECQGVWVVEIDLSDPSDNPCTGVMLEHPNDYCHRIGSLCEMLHGMVLGETFISLWEPGGNGPLGDYAPDVTGGVIMDPTDEQRDRIRALQPVPVLTSPYFPEQVRGGTDLLLRVSDPMIEWMARTPEAQARAAVLLK